MPTRVKAKAAAASKKFDTVKKQAEAARKKVLKARATRDSAKFDSMKKDAAKSTAKRSSAKFDAMKNDVSSVTKEAKNRAAAKERINKTRMAKEGKPNYGPKVKKSPPVKKATVTKAKQAKTAALKEKVRVSQGGKPTPKPMTYADKVKKATTAVRKPPTPILKTAVSRGGLLAAAGAGGYLAGKALGLDKAGAKLGSKLADSKIRDAKRASLENKLARQREINAKRKAELQSGKAKPKSSSTSTVSKPSGKAAKGFGVKLKRTASEMSPDTKTKKTSSLGVVKKADVVKYAPAAKQHKSETMSPGMAAAYRRGAEAEKQKKKTKGK